MSMEVILEKFNVYTGYSEFSSMRTESAQHPVLFSNLTSEIFNDDNVT